MNIGAAGNRFHAFTLDNHTISGSDENFGMIIRFYLHVQER